MAQYLAKHSTKRYTYLKQRECDFEFAVQKGIDRALRPHSGEESRLLRLRAGGRDLEEVDIAEGTIYPILRRLTLENYFETYLQESSEGPPRKYYRMTKLGRDAQADQILQWKDFNKNINALLRTGDKNE